MKNNTNIFFFIALINVLFPFFHIMYSKIAYSYIVMVVKTVLTKQYIDTGTTSIIYKYYDDISIS